MSKDFGKILGILASIAAIVGTCVAIIALIPAFGQWVAIINDTPNIIASSTSVSIATVPHTKIPPTNLPTFTIAPPTKTLVPTEIPPTNTPTLQPNTGLQLGQTYQKGNVAFTVVSVDYEIAGGLYSGTYISINVEVKNISQSSISFIYGDPTFTVKDNHGIIYKDGFATAKGRTFEDSIIISAGDSSGLDGYLCCGLAYGVDHSDASITEITFIVENLSSIEYAEWVIPINH